ncbi:uncharacterized protein LOC142167106 [Nicotiana tabacum]|uniref:Uncharacterized protein LOC142167106 n=1 Tax=Nicotiana tabacum TaxID=4097 RepID=A0AC58SEF8_TOBAC
MVKPILSKTPYELFRGRKPNITHLRAFGCKCFVHNNGKEALGKFDGRSDEGIFLGYSSYGLQHEDYDIGLTGEGASNQPELQSDNGSGDPKEVESDHEDQEEERTILTTNQTDETIPTDTVEPKNKKEALRDPDWITAINKLDEQGNITRNKARLVVQGYNQEEGIDYDETFIPIARMEAIRRLIAFAAHMEFTLYQMDIKSVFLNGYLNEEVFVKQPPRFESE